MKNITLDKIFRIIKNTHSIDLEAVHFMYGLLVKKNVDLSSFTVVECNTIRECDAWTITISDIFATFFRNNSIVSNKKYAKYYMNPQLSAWLVEKSCITDNNTILDCNVLINGYLKYINNIHVTGYQTQQVIHKILQDEHSGGLKQTDLIYEERMRHDLQKYDRIFYTIPSDVHNITHASCANYIKKLKIRGTCYEAICLQMISMLLARKGKAVVTISDTFLKRDTLQIVQTRKYLMDNFNIKEIIKIDDSFNPIKGVMYNSIIIFEEGDKTEEIEFSTIKLNGGEVITQNKISVPADIIRANNYRYTNTKQTSLKLNNIDESYSFDDLFEIIPSSDDFDSMKSYICLDKNKSIFVSLKTTSHPIYLYYLKYRINNNPDEYLDKSVFPKIPDADLDLMYNQIQGFTVLSNLKLKLYEEGIVLKKQLLALYIEHQEQIDLSTICDISNQHDKNCIGVLNNTTNAGFVVYNVEKSLKSYWWLSLKPNKPNMCLKFVYYYIWYNYDNLQTISKMKSQNYLSQNNIIHLKIPYIPYRIQQLITQKCDLYTTHKPPPHIEGIEGIEDFDLDLLFNSLIKEPVSA